MRLTNQEEDNLMSRTMTQGFDTIGIEEVKAQHKGHFFEPDAMRFFRSRVAELAYRGPGGTYFVTSEQFEDSTGKRWKRLYTVRQFNPETGGVSTVEGFQRYSSRSGATDAAMRAAKGQPLGSGQRSEEI